MNTISDRDKRTLRWAAVAIVAYLVLFFGVRGWKHFESGHSRYQELVLEAERLKQEVQPYENKALLAQKLSETLHLNPAKLSRASVVAEASAAIQKAAKSGAIQVGPIRESSARSSARELTSMQLEGTGQASAILGFLHRMDSLGYPVIMDSLQLTPDNKPGTVKFSLTLIILDFDQWKKEEKPNA